MKKLFLLLFFIFGLISVFSQTQITLTFIGKDSANQNLISLDSVIVKNLTENSDTLLYGPIPVLSLLANWPVGINEISGNNSEALILKQNYPNPFHGSTFVNIYRQNGGPMNLILFDELGKKIAEYQNVFEKGFHSFVISSSGNKVLFLVVFDDKNNRSIKIISAGQSNESNTIQYFGQSPDINQNRLKNQDNSGFIFYLGNQLMYTAHADGYHQQTIIDNPLTDSTYYFNMAKFYLPIVTTSPVTDITQTTATSGGNVISDGGVIVTVRGVCWSLTPNPTTSDYHTIDGSGMGSFISYLTGLTPNMQYFLRSYATNSIGTGYGNEVVFTTGQTNTTPIVITAAITNISQTTATSGGDVTYDGGASVTARGVCWSTSSNPTTAGNHTTDGIGTGIFVSNLTGLTGNTFYYVRAYATNSVGTSYGNELTFTTLTLPTVTTATVTNITQNTATSGGTITSDGGATVTVRGVCWSTSPNPTTAGTHTTDGSGTGTFVSNIIGLTESTFYYVRAYATNSVGTSYGNELTFTTLNPFLTCGDIVSYEGKFYNTVQIGIQCWFEQNLNVGTRISGSQTQTNNSIKEKYCYNDLESYCDEYGAIYQWDELMQYTTMEGTQGLCPPGWHLPTDGEWMSLATYLGGENVTGGKLKEVGTVHWLIPNTGATNSSGFTALPAGEWANSSGIFTGLTIINEYWSSSQQDAQGAWNWYLMYDNAGMYRNYTYKNWGYSSRCVMN